jgi:adenylate cyclase
LEVGGNDPEVRANAAVALSYFGEDIGAMMALIDGALALNPSFARGWSISAMRRLWAGQLQLAIAHAETPLRLSPRARVGSPLLAIGAAHFLSRRFDLAVPALLLAVQDDPGFPEPHRFLAACYAHMSRLDDARDILDRLRSLTSSITQHADYLRTPEHRELFLSGLRLRCRQRRSLARRSTRPFTARPRLAGSSSETDMGALWARRERPKRGNSTRSLHHRQMAQSRRSGRSED